MVKIISIEMIQKRVADFYNVTVADLKTNRRSSQIVLPRQIAMHLTRRLTKHSLPEIGNAFGGKDHTTHHLFFKGVTEKRIAILYFVISYHFIFPKLKLKSYVLSKIFHLYIFYKLR